MEDQSALPARASDDRCLRCGADLTTIGIDDFRVGGTTGGWKLLFGEWAELGEGMLRLEVRACTMCRTVDLRVPEAAPGFQGDAVTDRVR